MNIYKLLPLSIKYFCTSLLFAMKSNTILKIMQFSFEGDYCIAEYYVTTSIVVLVNFTIYSMQCIELIFFML